MWKAFRCWRHCKYGDSRRDLLLICGELVAERNPCCGNTTKATSEWRNCKSFGKHNVQNNSARTEIFRVSDRSKRSKTHRAYNTTSQTKGGEDLKRVMTHCSDLNITRVRYSMEWVTFTRLKSVSCKGLRFDGSCCVLISIHWVCTGGLSRRTIDQSMEYEITYAKTNPRIGCCECRIE